MQIYQFVKQLEELEYRRTVLKIRFDGVYV